MAYRIFSTQNDLEINARDHFPEGAVGDIDGRIASFLGKSPWENIDDRMKKAGEILQPGLLSRDPQRPITFLLDCSGSMRGPELVPYTEFLNRLFADMQEKDIPFEVLGHTTRSWRGGEAGKQYLEQARASGERMPSPGRLCDLLHVVFKDLDEPWVSGTMSLLHREGFLRENVDGEALEWASRRARSRGGPADIVHLGDGTPCDASTLEMSGESFLKDHLASVIASLEDDPGVSLVRLHLFTERYSFPKEDGPDVFLARKGSPEDLADKIGLALGRLTEKNCLPDREVRTCGPGDEF